MAIRDELYEGPFEMNPDKSTWVRGSIVGSSRERAKKRAATKEQVSMRFERDVLEAYRELAQGGSYQQLMHHALRQWLEAQSVAAMVREELREELDAIRHSGKTLAAAGD